MAGADLNGDGAAHPHDDQEIQDVSWRAGAARGAARLTRPV